MCGIWHDTIKPTLLWIDTTILPFLDYWVQLFLPAVLVFFVARYAQDIFHKNARARENRERKLKRIEGLISDTCEANKYIRSFLFDNLPSVEHAQDMLGGYIINLDTYAIVYDLDISNESTELNNAFTSIAKLYFEKTTNMVNKNVTSKSMAEAKELIPGTDALVMEIENQKVDKCLYDARNKILLKLSDIHQKIETDQLQ